MRLGDAATDFLMHIFIVVIGIKVFGWIAIPVGLGAYAVGMILNGWEKKRKKGKVF